MFGIYLDSLQLFILRKFWHKKCLLFKIMSSLTQYDLQYFDGLNIAKAFYMCLIKQNKGL